MRSFRSSRVIVLAALALLGAAAAPSDAEGQGVLPGPRVTSAGVSDVVTMSVSNLVSPNAVSLAAASPLQGRYSSRSSSVAMMIVGGAAVVVGGVVGGDGGTIIAVSGAVIGLIGLFRYLE